METDVFAPEIRFGLAALSVSHLERSIAFYRETLGFRLVQRDNDNALLGVDTAMLLLIQEKDAGPRPINALGLYHIAILVPGRADLAGSLRHLREVAYPLRDASDHIVSEALYLDDPDGNGIEIYRDRPRSTWPWQNGRLYGSNSSEPLDLENLLSELDENDYTWRGLPSRTCIGHIHLQVADLGHAATFYRKAFGLDETITGIAGACFLAAHGYHHHLGLNTWNSLGASRPRENVVGLRFFVICLRDAAAVERIAAQLEAAGIPWERWKHRGHGADLNALVLHDADGNTILVMADLPQSNEEVISLAKMQR
ncbi:MAG TPA: VOC family protein [Ktedonobacteraceae bacterium]|jgi:catechol 2,3-dioxygenase|nr:VOC family protein [Ktedonobacteraceae bacterium]